MNLCQQHPNYQQIPHPGTGSVIPLYKVHSRKLTPHKQSSAINMNCVQCMTLTQVTRKIIMLLIFFGQKLKEWQCPSVLFKLSFKLSFKLFFKLTLKLKRQNLCFLAILIVKWYKKFLIISGLPHSFSTILFASSSGSSGNRKCFRKSPKH